MEGSDNANASGSDRGEMGESVQLAQPEAGAPGPQTAQPGEVAAALWRISVILTGMFWLGLIALLVFAIILAGCSGERLRPPEDQLRKLNGSR